MEKECKTYQSAPDGGVCVPPGWPDKDADPESSSICSPPCSEGSICITDFEACAPYCSSNSDCDSDCCLNLVNGGQACAPANSQWADSCDGRVAPDNGNGNPSNVTFEDPCDYHECAGSCGEGKVCIEEFSGCVEAEHESSFSCVDSAYLKNNCPQHCVTVACGVTYPNVCFCMPGCE